MIHIRGKATYISKQDDRVSIRSTSWRVVSVVNPRYCPAPLPMTYPASAAACDCGLELQI